MPTAARRDAQARRAGAASALDLWQCPICHRMQHLDHNGIDNHLRHCPQLPGNTSGSLHRTAAVQQHEWHTAARSPSSTSDSDSASDTDDQEDHECEYAPSVPAQNNTKIVHLKCTRPQIVSLSLRMQQRSLSVMRHTLRAITSTMFPFSNLEKCTLSRIHTRESNPTRRTRRSCSLLHATRLHTQTWSHRVHHPCQ